jgi:hypothetical protein
MEGLGGKTPLFIIPSSSPESVEGGISETTTIDQAATIPPLALCHPELGEGSFTHLNCQPSITPLTCHPELVSGSDDCIEKKIASKRFLLANGLRILSYRYCFTLVSFSI